ncbi:Protein kinase-like domain containing protein [Naviculisporaceae sp. PSN 640]
MIGTSGLLYRFSESLVYKLLVSQREYLLMDAAGPLTLRPLTRVLWKDTNQNRLKGIVEGRTKAVIMEFGKKFRPSDIPPHKLRNVVIDMLMLVQMLHNQCGIVHGDIKPSNFLWGREGRLKIAGFNSARFIEEDPDLWSDEHVSEAFLTPERMRTREGKVKRTPAPKVFDDYYALGITLWWVYTGKSPANGQFNRRDIRKSDLGEVPDELVRRWIRKVFKMAGCRFW